MAKIWDWYRKQGFFVKTSRMAIPVVFGLCMFLVGVFFTLTVLNESAYTDTGGSTIEDMGFLVTMPMVEDNYERDIEDAMEYAEDGFAFDIVDVTLTCDKTVDAETLTPDETYKTCSYSGNNAYVIAVEMLFDSSVAADVQTAIAERYSDDIRLAVIHGDARRVEIEWLAPGFISDKHVATNNYTRVKDGSGHYWKADDKSLLEGG